MAAQLVPTGFLPEAIKKPEQAVAIMLKGRELGVPPMYALSNIAIVKGKPTISAEMMLALIYRDHGKGAIRVRESTNDHCTIDYRLPGWDVASYTFTIQDAAQAGLANSPTWKNYPAAMLRARCISAVARMAFPESIAGMYVPGELGDPVTVTDDGEVVSTTTGEVIDVSPQPQPLPTGNAPQERQEAPGRDESAVNRRLHGLVGHDPLHGFAKSKGLASWADVPPTAAVALLDILEPGGEVDQAKVDQFISRYLPEQEARQPQLTEADIAEIAGEAGDDRFTR